ncbi:probable methyltransferase-like protein 24 [Biomphalaria glabrata]|uniref:Probable methyltransferase-like protein 24 n=1 Tax=Biomphalaria glabrata TaxID=6526 RepID=A0A9W2YZW4_BIOGL|nr:probable methyltransferase-like protein 24 [Biomphalaria glabrata]
MRIPRCGPISPKNVVRLAIFLLLQLLLLAVVLQLNQQVVQNIVQCDHHDNDLHTKDVPCQQLIAEDTGTGPLGYLRVNSHVTDLSSLEISNMSTTQLLLTVHSYLDNADVICQRKIRMGRIDDGGWEVCDDPDVRPREPCIIYSFGINDDFSFDDDSARLYGCHIYSFDPSMVQSAIEYNRSSKVHFYRIGLGGTTLINNKQWPLFTLTDIRRKLGHQNATIDIIKMDIEGSEWGALPQMLRHGELEGVRQFYIEYHLTRDDRRYILPRLKAIQGLARAGFKKFYVHKNKITKTSIKGFPVSRTRCYEVHYLRR